VIDVNLGGCFNMAKATFPECASAVWGRIVNIGSINGQAGAVRAGELRRRQERHPRLHQGAGAGRREVRGDGERHRAGLHRHGHGGGGAADVLEKIVAKIPAGGWGRRRRSRGGVVFLCGEDAGFVTGSTLSINGGQHMYRT
jgi:acetoacetyl-CoA reductase